jgi:hypothetical protein
VVLTVDFALIFSGAYLQQSLAHTELNPVDIACPAFAKISCFSDVHEPVGSRRDEHIVKALDSAL